MSENKQKMFDKQAKTGCLGCLTIVVIVLIVAAIMAWHDNGTKQTERASAPNQTSYSTWTKSELEKAYGLPYEKLLAIHDTYDVLLKSSDNPLNKSLPVGYYSWSKEEQKKWNKQNTEEIDKYEQKCAEKVAKQFGISAEKVKLIYAAVEDYLISQKLKSNK